MIELLTGFVGARWARPAFYALIAVLLGAALTVGKCAWDARGVSQAKQTTRSGEAIAKAAGSAVNTVSNRTDAEKDIDAAVGIAKQEIGNAQSPDAIRDAVVRAVCVRRENRNDPACRVQ